MEPMKCLQKLKDGNRRYLSSVNQIGDISLRVRHSTARQGQHPFAVIVDCSDSREIPEAIFSCGIGELFVIRVAGNVTDDSVLGSIEYATEHLGCTLVVVLGHTDCGAVATALSGGAEGHTKRIIDRITAAIGTETDPRQASCLNVRNTVSDVRQDLSGNPALSRVQVVGALYDIDNGKVDFLEG